MRVMLRCPLPNILSMRNSVNATQNNPSANSFRIALQWQGSPKHDMTSTFPVCQLTKPPPLSESSSDQTFIATSRQNRLKFSVAVCSTLEEKQHVDDNSIIAWIEYHKVLGVEHFFLYDLSTHAMKQANTSSSETAANATGYIKLGKYIESGTVTMIPWRYHGCVDASDDPFFCEDPLLDRDKKSHSAYPAFIPPG